MSDEGEWERESGVECVIAPCCGFVFAAEHKDDTPEGGYSCSVCENLALEKRVDRARMEVERLRVAIRNALTYSEVRPLMYPPDRRWVAIEMPLDVYDALHEGGNDE
jgi:hypothetical protein